MIQHVRDSKMVLAGFAAGIAMFLIVAATVWRQHDINAFEQRVDNICQTVERLKEQERQDAHSSFDNLEQNLELLGIKTTPEFVAVARMRRDQRLARFAASPC